MLSLFDGGTPYCVMKKVNSLTAVDGILRPQSLMQRLEEHVQIHTRFVALELLELAGDDRARKARACSTRR